MCSFKNVQFLSCFLSSISMVVAALSLAILGFSGSSCPNLIDLLFYYFITTITMTTTITITTITATAIMIYSMLPLSSCTSPWPVPVNCVTSPCSPSTSFPSPYSTLSTSSNYSSSSEMTQVLNKLVVVQTKYWIIVCKLIG